MEDVRINQTDRCVQYAAVCAVFVIVCVCESGCLTCIQALLASLPHYKGDMAEIQPLCLSSSLLCFARCSCTHSLSCQGMLGLNRENLVGTGCPILACLQNPDSRVPRQWGISLLSPLTCTALLRVLCGCRETLWASNIACFLQLCCLRFL